MRFSAAGLLAALCALISCQHSAYAPWPRELAPGTVRHYSCRKISDSTQQLLANDISKLKKELAALPKTDAGKVQGEDIQKKISSLEFEQSQREGILLDGILDEEEWDIAPWSEHFVDIEGTHITNPRFGTWMKMLWDNDYLYVAAFLEEPHVWGTYNKRDMVVFHENDFEIFIDPQYEIFTGHEANHQSYYEIEFNVIGTVFDLYLTKEYRKGGIAHHEWNCEGLVGVLNSVGTQNNHKDEDTGWYVEIAIPFKCLRPPSTVQNDVTENIRDGLSPLEGDRWRINFSRVEWELEKVGTGYVKKPGTKEDNWVWSPQWAIDMHRLEHWGILTFID